MTLFIILNLAIALGCSVIWTPASAAEESAKAPTKNTTTPSVTPAPNASPPVPPAVPNTTTAGVANEEDAEEDNAEQDAVSKPKAMPELAPDTKSLSPAVPVVPAAGAPATPLLKGCAETTEDRIARQYKTYGIELGKEDNGGRLVANVKAHSVAASWGIKAGDRIMNLDTPSKLKVERNGKTSPADLTVNKTLRTAVTRMVGQYAGRVSVPTEEVTIGAGSNFVISAISPMITQFFEQPPGVITGSYVQTHGGTCDGYLTGATLISPREVCFNWRDRAGSGILMIKFSPDYKSFNGYWNFSQRAGNRQLGPFGPTSRVLLWNGTRRGKESTTQPYP